MPSPLNKQKCSPLLRGKCSINSVIIGISGENGLVFAKQIVAVFFSKSW